MARDGFSYSSMIMAFIGFPDFGPSGRAVSDNLIHLFVTRDSILPQYSCDSDVQTGKSPSFCLISSRYAMSSDMFMVICFYGSAYVLLLQTYACFVGYGFCGCGAC